MSCGHFPRCAPPVPRVRRLAAAAAAAIALCSHMTATAEEKPLWEAGLGLAAMRIPAYRGSDQSNHLVLPLPYLVYRGEFLKADRNGVRGQLFESDDIDFTLSAALSPPASSRKIRARDGMPDLDANFEIGPQIDVSLWRNVRRSRQIKFQMPVRAAFTLDRRPQSIGWVIHPRPEPGHHRSARHGWLGFGFAIRSSFRRPTPTRVFLQRGCGLRHGQSSRLSGPRRLQRHGVPVGRIPPFLRTLVGRVRALRQPAERALCRQPLGAHASLFCLRRGGVVDPGRVVHAGACR